MVITFCILSETIAYLTGEYVLHFLYKFYSVKLF